MRNLVLCVACLLAACGRGEEIIVRDVWIREAPPGAEVHAGYLTLENHADTELVLERIVSPGFARIELHEMRVQDGRMRMRRLDRLPVPAKSSVRLEPGGTHLMLFTAAETVTAGQRVPLELYFGARIVSVHAEVRRKD